MTANPVAVTPEQHKNLKVRRDTGFAYAAKTHVVPIVLNEFADVASNCPIIFVKGEIEGQLRVAAMLGIEVEKNLFVKDNDWLGTHIPMNLGRVPFSFVPLDDKALGAAIDTNSEMVSETEGEALFTEAGEPTDYFKQVNSFLSSLFQGELATQKFVEAVEKHDLLREFKLQMTGEDGARKELVGLFAPSAKRVQALSDEAILELHKEGHLAAVHIAIQSMSQVRRLVRLQNETGENKINAVHIEIMDDAEPVTK